VNINFDQKSNIVILMENSSSALPIILNIDRKYLIGEIEGIEQFFDNLKKTLPVVEAYAIEAFSDTNNHEAWQKIQAILYLWNLQDLCKNNCRDFIYSLNMLLRNKIVEVENK
jgi:hypothetical protein